MSLAIKYENVEDARMRLRNTVVLYKDEPVYIRDVQHGNGGKDDILRVKFDALPVLTGVPDRFGRVRRIDEIEGEAGGEGQRKFISSKYFDIGAFKMGYVNRFSGTGAFFCSRMPNRIQKQGLCAENFKGVDNFGGQVGFQIFLGCKEVPAMIANKYPTFEQAVKALAKCAAVAFHREFCLVKDDVIPDFIYLYHKGNKVGMHHAGQISLGQKFNCLKESLEEMRIKVGAL